MASVIHLQRTELAAELTYKLYFVLQTDTRGLRYNIVYDEHNTFFNEVKY